MWDRLFREPMPADRTAQAAALAKKVSCTVVLKGAGTVVTDGNRVYVNTTGNSPIPEVPILQVPVWVRRVRTGEILRPG